MCEANKQRSESTTYMTMSPTISSLESSCLAICSPLHVSVHCRLFFVQSVQEASAFTYPGKCHDRRSQRSPSSSFVRSLARYIRIQPLMPRGQIVSGDLPLRSRQTDGRARAGVAFNMSVDAIKAKVR